MDGSTPVVCEADKNIFDPDLNPANNRMATGKGWSYDTAGNVTTDPDGRTFTYDTENKQTEVENLFDILGRVTGHKQTTDGEEYETYYTYNLSGALIEQPYPSGRKVKNVIDNNGDLSMVQSARCLDSTPGTNATCTSQAGLWNYAKNFTYNAAGAVTSMQLGNNRCPLVMVTGLK